MVLNAFSPIRLKKTETNGFGVLPAGLPDAFPAVSPAALPAVLPAPFQLFAQLAREADVGNTVSVIDYTWKLRVKSPPLVVHNISIVISGALS